MLYLVYLHQFLGLFMSYLCDLFFIFSLIFISYTLLKQIHLFFVHFLEYLLLFLDDNVMKKANNFQMAKVQPQGVA